MTRAAIVLLLCALAMSYVMADPRELPDGTIGEVGK